MKYLIPFLVSFSLTVSLIVFGILLGKKIPWKGRTSSRHGRSQESFRLGGMAMVLAFFVTLLWDDNLVMNSPFYGVAAAALILLIVGIWDDLREISWKFQLVGQIAASALAVIFGVRIYYVSNPITGAIIHFNSSIGIFLLAVVVVLWVVLMMNSMNWLDGVDGLSGGVAFIGALTIFFLSLKPEVNQPPMAILSAAFAGVILGFLVFNFYPSRVMAGTAGSTFMGFILAVLAIFAGTKIATSILVLFLPLMDLFRVAWERWRLSRSVFEPDELHFHHALIRRGWSPRKIVFYFYSVTILLALVALNTRVIGKGIALAVVCGLMAVVLPVTRKKNIRHEVN